VLYDYTADLHDIGNRTITLMLVLRYRGISGSINRVPALIDWGKVFSVGWQVTLCDPIRHVSSRSSEAFANCYTRLLYLTLEACFCLLRVCDVMRSKRLLFHRRTRASYVYNGCLAWYNVVLYNCLSWYKFVNTHFIYLFKHQ